MAAVTSPRVSPPSGTDWKQQRRNVLSRNLLKENALDETHRNGVNHEPK